ncbi:MAG TPA: thioesterase family protein [Frankiaceae bacterium]|nr:thioesterase family protein [Frankiaceae bacterium]
MSVPAAFYEPLGGDRFRSTAATGGPWDLRLQHAGPPSALLARAFERCRPHPDLRLVRMTTDILGPVPVAELTVRARVARAGRRVELLDGVVEADGREVLRGSAWRIATTAAGSAPLVPEPGTPPPLPPEQPTTFWPGAQVAGYIAAIEWRFADGSFATAGPARVWTRPKLPLVVGEDVSALGRVLLVADSGSGVSAELDLQDWLFINTDLTVLLHRHPAGAWVCMESRTRIDADGIGMAETRLSDGDGRIGRALQSLLVAPR